MMFIHLKKTHTHRWFVPPIEMINVGMDGMVDAIAFLALPGYHAYRAGESESSRFFQLF